MVSDEPGSYTFYQQVKKFLQSSFDYVNMSFLAELRPVSIQSLMSNISGAYQEQQAVEPASLPRTWENHFTVQANSSKLNKSLIVFTYRVSSLVVLGEKVKYTEEGTIVNLANLQKLTNRMC